MRVNGRGEYILQVSPAQALRLRDIANSFLPDFVRIQLKLEPPIWDKLQPYYWSMVTNSLDFEFYKQIKDWFGKDIAEECLAHTRIFLQVIQPVIPRRLKWWAKLVYPQINTQQTQFKYCDRTVYFHRVTETVRVMEWSLTPTDIKPALTYETVRIDLKPFLGFARHTHAACLLYVGYSERLDLCLIYNADHNLHQQIKHLYPLDWRLYLEKEFSR